MAPGRLGAAGGGLGGGRAGAGRAGWRGGGRLSRGARLALPWVGWWLLWRLPFFRPLPDFFDAPEFQWRVRGGFWSGLHHPGAHLPLQGTVYGPAGALYSALGGRVSEVACMATLAMLYGLVAYLALVALWRRVFAPEVAALAALLYPLLSGPALADGSTYSASAIDAFFFAGTALVVAGLGELCHAPRRAALQLGAGALGFGLAAYTHLIALPWASVPAGLLAGYVWGPLGCPRCQPGRAERLRWAALGAALPCAGAVVLALGLGTWEVAHVRGLDLGAAFRALVLRDWDAAKPPLSAERLKLVRDHFQQVTGYLGAFVFVLGLWRWARREGPWARLTAALVLLSLAATARQYVWGLSGRIYFPLLALAVPLLIEALSGLRWERVGLGLVFLQSAVTTLAVLGTRRFDPSPTERLEQVTAELARRGDAYVTEPQHRTFNLDGERQLTWGSLDDGPGLDALRAQADGRERGVWTDSGVLRFPNRLRDGHLLAMTDWKVKVIPSSLEQYAARSASVLLDAPLGRGEFLAELGSPREAPPLAERLRRASRNLEEGYALLLGVAEPTGDPLVVEVQAEGAACLSRERYDAWEVLALLVQLASSRCDPADYGTADATGLLLRPVQPRSLYRLWAHRWRDPARPATPGPALDLHLTLGEGDLREASLEEAIAAAAGQPQPFAGVVAPAGRPGRVRFALRSLGP